MMVLHLRYNDIVAENRIQTPVDSTTGLSWLAINRIPRRSMHTHARPMAVDDDALLEENVIAGAPRDCIFVADGRVHGPV